MGKYLVLCLIFWLGCAVESMAAGQIQWGNTPTHAQVGPNSMHKLPHGFAKKEFGSASKRVQKIKDFEDAQNYLILLIFFLGAGLALLILGAGTLWAFLGLVFLLVSPFALIVWIIMLAQ